MEIFRSTLTSRPFWSHHHGIGFPPSRRLSAWPSRASWLGRKSNSITTQRFSRYPAQKITQQRLARILRHILAGIAVGAAGLFSLFYVTDTRAAFHRWLAVPLLRLIYPDAEAAHHAGVGTLRLLHRYGLNPRERELDGGTKGLEVEVFGHKLSNPLAISGGLDKNGEIPDALFALGPAIVEIGGVTPLPQDGNPKPRVWRVQSQRGMVNRYGLNSQGAHRIADRLRQRVGDFAYANGFGSSATAEDVVLNGGAEVPPGSLHQGRLLAIQISKNKSTPDSDLKAVKNDYVCCVEILGRYADILVVNVSSPNTPGLRDLQKLEPLTEILTAVVDATRKIARRKPPAIMVKVSPDEDSDDQISGICKAICQSGIDGVIVGNTTTRKLELEPIGSSFSSEERGILQESGGYSGPQLFKRTLNLVERYWERFAASNIAGPSKVIFATGGIANGSQALEVLKAGASVAMVYTALIYGGSGTITRIKHEMQEKNR